MSAAHNVKGKREAFCCQFKKKKCRSRTSDSVVCPSKDMQLHYSTTCSYFRMQQRKQKTWHSTQECVPAANALPIDIHLVKVFYSQVVLICLFPPFLAVYCVKKGSSTLCSKGVRRTFCSARGGHSHAPLLLHASLFFLQF